MKPSLSNRRYLYALVAFNVLPHTSNVPVWICIASFTVILCRWLVDLEYFAIPNKKWIIAVSFAFTLGIWQEYKVLWGEQAAAALLIIFAALKLFEIRSYRDLMIVTYMCYFLLMSKLLDSQSIGMTVYLFVDVILITALLAHHHSPMDHGRTRFLLKRSWTLAWQATPFIVLLFVLFPRFNTGLSGGTKQGKGLTGFSDQIRPGSISELVQSDELVFRATFISHDAPPVSKMYWRGAELVHSRGLEWDRREKYQPKPLVDVLVANDRVDQEILLEPTMQKWIFTLDWPTQIIFASTAKQNQLSERGARTFQLRDTITNREYYRVSSAMKSWPEFWEQPGPEYLDVSDIEGKKLRELAADMRRGTETTSELIQKYLNYFQEQGFQYDLKPPQVDNLEDFIFKKKIGFCEHYAAAMASMLRLNHIPTRVIVGFQGGIPSIFESQWLIRQLDAHAWLEYWNAETKTWLRIDPTAIIAPMRLARGGDFYLTIGENLQNQYPILSKVFSVGMLQTFYETKKNWLKIESVWVRFLLTYDFSYQQKVLSNFGISQTEKWQLTLGLTVILVTFGVLLYLFWNKRSLKIEPSLALYRELCDKLRRNGVERYDTEGPLSYRRRALKQLGEQPELEELFNKLIQLRFGPSQWDIEEVQEFRSSIRRLKIDQHSTPR